MPERHHLPPMGNSFLSLNAPDLSYLLRQTITVPYNIATLNQFPAVCRADKNTFVSILLHSLRADLLRAEASADVHAVSQNLSNYSTLHKVAWQIFPGQPLRDACTRSPLKSLSSPHLPSRNIPADSYTSSPERAPGYNNTGIWSASDIWSGFLSI